ncbi:MAG: hypothetical protein LWY06_08470 [Firmicutes bacterium]|nr:hypothetical protein [Bacillota bacterium]
MSYREISIFHAGMNIDQIRRLLMENLLNTLVLERYYSIEINGAKLQKAIELKRQNALLFELVMKAPDLESLGLPPTAIRKIELTDEMKPKFAVDTTKLSLKAGIILISRMNQVNFRLYRSIINFAQNCKKVLFNGVESGATYNKSGNLKSYEGHLQVNLKA